MARKQTLEIATNAGMERLIVGLVSKLAVVVPPWAVLTLLTITAAISHALWGKPPAVSWAAMAGTLATMLLTALTWAVSHQRGPLGRIHSTVTTLAAGLWFTIATITGVLNLVTGGMLFFGGLALGLAWNIRAIIRSGNGDGGSGDPLARLFENAKASFGLGGATVRTKEVTDHKIKAKMALPAGEKVADDVIKRTKYIEGGMHFPPGSVVIAEDLDDASQAHFTVTDPRVMNRPIPWPGPSRPGESIAEPLRIGIFQDAEPCEIVITGNHLQIMGGSGSGKSLGGAWNILGEAITRPDVACFGVDLAKDTQTFGPLLPALHGVALTKAKASAFVRKVNELVPQRTAWLSQRGYTEWEPGCGLTYWLIDFEEISKVFKILGQKDQDKIEEISKEIRSAGGRIITSLQRSTYTEMPTIIRSQMAFMCFGLNSSDDGQYGLSEAQQRLECAPELWGAGKPEHVGKAYIDAKGVPETHIGMPMRTFSYGKTPRAAAATLTQHAAQYPASAKQIDEFTQQLVDLLRDEAIPMPPVGGSHQEPDDYEDIQDDIPEGYETDDDLGDDDADLSEEMEEFLELLANAAELVISTQHASTAMIQRKLRLPHEQCERIMSALEMKGVIGPQPRNTTQPRPILVTADDLDDVLQQLREDGDPTSEYLRTEDPDPAMTAGPDDEIVEPTLKEDRFYVGNAEQDAQRASGGKMPPEQARAQVYTWIRERAAQGPASRAFTPTDPGLTAVRQRCGMTSRGWIYKVLDNLVDQGVLAVERGRQTTYTIVDLAPLDDRLPQPA
jgi:hypothetical protein